MAQELAGPFELYIPSGFHSHSRKILYVGKATANAFDEENAAELAFGGRSAFWKLAERLSKLATPDCTDLSNLAWSNIFKQGVKRGNPLGDVAESQRPAAIKALREESRMEGLSLIVFVTAGYYEDIVKTALDIADGESSPRALKRTLVPNVDADIWSRPPLDGLPPILWTYHPERKPRVYIDHAIAVASDLTGWRGNE